MRPRVDAWAVLSAGREAAGVHRQYEQGRAVVDDDDRAAERVHDDGAGGGRRGEGEGKRGHEGRVGAHAALGLGGVAVTRCADPDGGQAASPSVITSLAIRAPDVSRATSRS